LYRLVTWTKALLKLGQLRRKTPIAGVLSLWLAECTFIGGWFSKANHLPHFTWVVGQDARPQNHYVKRIRPEGERVIAFSDFLRRELERNFGVRAGLVVNNGVNAEAFPELNTGARRYDILGAGSLIPLKRYSLFLEIVHHLKKIFPEIRAAIAGDGPEMGALKTQIEARKPGGNIVLLGEVAHRETLALMNEAKIFLHTSEYEGNSTVLMEALYAGCQVLSFCRLADRDVENLWICEDATEMVATAERLLATPKPAKRVVFNLMKDSARRIVQLYESA
jgi:glycosyltransferase involved in cell wall biosynthesis